MCRDMYILFCRALLWRREEERSQTSSRDLPGPDFAGQATDRDCFAVVGWVALASVLAATPTEPRGLSRFFHCALPRAAVFRSGR